MAVYPSGNPGVAPPDLSSDIGKWRATAGDLNYTPYDPDAPGFGDFVYASDAEITQFLALAGDSVPGAVGFWYLQLAGAAALESKSVADHDLRVDSTKRAADLRAQANFWLGVGGISLNGEEAFEIVPTGTNECRHIEYYGWV